MARVFLLSRVRVGEESLQMVASTWVRYQKIRIIPGFACHLVLEDCSNLSNAYKSMPSNYPKHVTSLYNSMHTTHWCIYRSFSVLTMEFFNLPCPHLNTAATWQRKSREALSLVTLQEPMQTM